jgi:toxin ParE1/3/4
MQREVVFRPSALADLKSIHDYIEQHNPATAARFLERIEAHCMRLADFSERGTRRDELRAGLRIIGFERRVTVAFTVLTDTVEIPRVLYRGRDVEKTIRGDP